VKQKINRSLFGTLFISAVMLIITTSAMAGVVYKDGDKYLKIGGRIQLQYHLADPSGATGSDELFFRRLRPYIEGSIHKDWLGKFQFDLGKAEENNELSVKDAYLQYKGIDGLKVTIGNANFPFSRELLTSSKKQQLIERTFVGDHNYGTPDRQMGVHLTGNALDKTLTYGFSVAQAAIDPDDDKLDFDSLANRNTDFNEGLIVGGRIDYHPLGLLKMAQGDFKRKTLATIGVAAYSWNNDDDNNSRTTAGVADDPAKPDIDSANGLEVSGAFRAAGLSVDAEYNLFQAETIDPTVSSGLYKNGETDLSSYAVEAGYMVIPKSLELVAAYQVQDTDSYTSAWNRTSFGANYFFSESHDIKLQSTYRIAKNLKGVEGNDENELFVQMQYVF
jgi:phosphate-selective porin